MNTLIAMVIRCNHDARMDVCGLAIVWSTDKHVSIAAVRDLYDGVYHWAMAGLVLTGWAQVVSLGPGCEYSHGARLSWEE